MTPDQFFAKFALLSETPNAVAKMRELVLWQAFADTAQTQAWPKYSLKQLATKIGSGSTPDGGRDSYAAEGIPLIRSMNVHFDGFRDEGIVYLNNEQAAKLANVTVYENDVLLNITGASIGRVTIAPLRMTGARVNQHVTIIRCKSELEPNYLSKFLASPIVQNLINEIQVGATRQALTKSMIEQFKIPLPPAPEQKRIVAKVDELMALCDQLESQQKQRETKKATLVQAALTRFTDAPTPGNLEFLFHKSYAINPAELRKTILTLAVTGNLTKQDNELDGTALEALSAVQRFRAHSAINRSKVPDAIDLDGVPHDIPDTWEWVRLAQVTMSIDYGTSEKSDALADGIPVYRMGNIAGGKLVSQNMKYVRSTIDDLPKLYLKRGDLLFNRTNSAELVGKCAVFEGSDDEATFASYLIRVRLFHEVVSVSYVNIAMNAPYFRTTQIEPEIVQQCGQANFNGTKLARTMLPLPPLAEQKRIVAKVEELMALVDKLEAQLAASRDAGAKLIEAVVAELARAA